MSNLQELRRPAPDSIRLSQRLLPVLLFLGVVAVYAGTAARDDMHIDAHAAAVEAWHIAATGSPWLEGDLTAQMETNNFIGIAENGHTVGLRMPGPVLLGIPFYWTLNRSGVPADFRFAPAGIAASVAMAAAVVMIFLALRRLLPQLHALAASLVFAFATPSWTVSADQLWTHTVTQLGIAGAALACSTQRWSWVGVALGVAMLGRPHLALVAAVLGIGISLSRRQLRPAVQIAIPTCLSLAFLAAWNRWMFGGWSIGGAYANKAQAAVGGFDTSGDASAEAVSSLHGIPPELGNYLGFLASFDRGLLVWSPAILLLLPALWRSWRTLPDWSRWLLLGGVAYTVVQLRVNAFPGGDGFWAYRHGLELITCATPALALSAARAGRIARGLLPAVLAAQFAALTLGAIDQGFYVRVEDVWSDNSFWLALRHEPVVLGAWMAICVGIAVVGRMVWRRRPGSAPD